MKITHANFAFYSYVNDIDYVARSSFFAPNQNTTPIPNCIVQNTFNTRGYNHYSIQMPLALHKR
jgi:hypothetical protein